MKNTNEYRSSHEEMTFEYLVLDLSHELRYSKIHFYVY